MVPLLAALFIGIRGNYGSKNELSIVCNPSRANSSAVEAELAITKYLLSVGLYGEPILIISNTFCLSAIIRNHTEKHVLKEVSLSYTGFMIMWILWVWGDMLTTKIAESLGAAIRSQAC